MTEDKVIKVNELNLELIAPSTSGNHAGGFKLVVVGKPGCFKAGTRVMRFDGTSVPVESVKEGDLLMGDDSAPRTVLELCRGHEEMYKITPVKGDAIIVNKNHILSLKCTGYNDIKHGAVVNITVADYLNKSKTWKSRFKWYRTGVDFPHHEVKVDPYLLGIWLGDGTLGDARFTTADPEVVSEFKRVLEPQGLVVRQIGNSKYGYSISQSNGSRKWYGNLFREGLREIGVLDHKHIPQQYISNSRKVRLELLAGLLDSDGHLDKSNTYDFINKSEELVDGLLSLVRSLGMFAYKKKCEKTCTNGSNGSVTGTYYRCCISGNLEVIPNRIERKSASPRQINKDVLMTGVKCVESVGEDNYYGFTLDGNHLFLLDDYTVVHNTGKSSIISSILYAKKHLIPAGIIMSGSEDSNGFYSKMFPASFVFNEYDETQLKKFVKRQKLAKQKMNNPWAVVLCDDCTDSTKIFNTKIQQGMYKRGRHWNMLYILSLQYAMDINPAIRTNVDGVFILREPILKNRKSLYENYASVIGDFDIFCQLMDALTTDYCCLYIHNAIQTNRWQDCVFYYKADLPPDNFRFGCREFWKHHHDRFDPDHVNNFDDFDE